MAGIAICGAIILDKSSPGKIAVAINPFEGSFDVAAQFVKQRKISGPVRVKAKKDQKERCGIDRTVIGSVRNLSCICQLSRSQLVQDLSRFFRSPVIDLASLFLRKQF